MTVPDDLDHALIAALREDGRAPVSKLATILGVTRATVQTRLDRLLASGVVLGFTIRARRDYDPNIIRAVMMIEIAASGRSNTAMLRRLRGIPEIHALHTTNGTWDLIAEIQTATLPDFDRVLREVRSIDGVLNSETSLKLSTL